MYASTSKPYIVGYTGHIPDVQKEEVINRIVHKKYIPNYCGFIPS